MNTRVEYDLLGPRDLPSDVLYGVHTSRALENFAISGTSIAAQPELITALADVKQAAAEVNCALGLLEAERAEPIARACEEIRAGGLREHFVVDVIQGGAGTSVNMNANEVIANRALELLGSRPGDYERLHPIDHVNLGQSTNDVYPTAMRIALQRAAARLDLAMAELAEGFAKKAAEFADVRKLGRTQLQDAVPITLGQEFGTYAVMLGEDRQRLSEATALLREINLGGTAVGTGINAHPDYAARACERLRALTGLQLQLAPDLIEATQDAGALVALSGVLKRIAVKLSKLCNDLRLLASGPVGGLGEIRLPAVQAGSSIMPGKVNPVIPEVMNQIAFEVFGHDLTVTFAAEAGQLQLNAFLPIISRSLFESIDHIAVGCETLARRCVAGIEAERARVEEALTQSAAFATALSPHLGYEVTSALVKEARASARSVRELVLERGLVSEDELDRVLPSGSRPRRAISLAG